VPFDSRLAAGVRREIMAFFVDAASCRIRENGKMPLLHTHRQNGLPAADQVE
jgi:hypothetical protein